MEAVICGSSRLPGKMRWAGNTSSSLFQLQRFPEGDLASFRASSLTGKERHSLRMEDEMGGWAGLEAHDFHPGDGGTRPM